MLGLYETIEEMVVESAAGIRPPERLTVSEGAEKYRKLNNPGSFVGPWSNDVTPYLVEPQDTLQSRLYTGMIFVGPAQTGKTDMFLNWQTHSVICDPADMMLIQTSQTTARDFSKRRIDRLHRHSPDVGKRLVQHRNYDNTFDKRYSSGMMVTLSWPTINELSGKPIPRLWLTDYDRMTQDVDGEGSPFDLARKRATSFQSYGMCAAESSPGFTIDNPRWIPSTAHEAPPTQGILALYNRGDRRRWRWQCVSCQGTFEPAFSLLDYPKSKDKMESAEQVVLPCPHCGQIYHHDFDEKLGVPGKNLLNQLGRWVPDGMILGPNGQLHGTPIRSDIASFWMKGVAAAFTNWKSLVFNYLTAVEEHEKTGSQESLKTTVNVDQGEPYLLKGMEAGRLPEDIIGRARDLGVRVIPPGVRFLVPCIDVQKNRWVVQVHGIGQGNDIYIIDRFDVRISNRRDELDPTQKLWVNPGAYPEDWRLLVEHVLQKTYPLADGSGRHMSVKQAFCDSGGKDGTTANAYEFWRWLRDGSDDEEADEESGWVPNLHRRFQLTKGEPKPGVPRVRISFPDSERKDRHAGARGEVPVLFMNTNMMKDFADKRLDRTDPHGGRVNFPKWLDQNFFTELTVEVRTEKGWENKKRFRNESWDLLVMAFAGIISQRINVEKPGFWEDPPAWAEEWDANELVFHPEKDDKPFAQAEKPKYDLRTLASKLA